jgi:ABC-2 type transport system permease protein
LRQAGQGNPIQSPVISALLYLRFTSLKNVLVARLKRLKQPQYLAGALVGGFYLWVVFLRPMAARPRSAHGPAFDQAFSSGVETQSGLMAALGAILLLIMTVFTWVLPKDKPGLRFTEAETAFLFPAPVSRRMLINFKLLGAQVSILFTSLFFALIFQRSGATVVSAIARAIGWWVILSTINLHLTGAALTVTRLIEGGVSTLRRRLMVLGAIALVVAATAAWVWRDLRAPTPAELSASGLTHYLMTILNGSALGLILWPFRIVLGPFLAAGTEGFLLTLPPALLLMAAHYYWVMRMEVSFEEASIADAEKRTALIARVREGKYQLGQAAATARPGPFHLADTGNSTIAFLWKNLLSTRPYFNLRTFAVIVAIIVVGSRWLPREGELATMIKLVIAGFFLFVGVYTLILGPHLARQDLRSDLGNADVLKTYPIRGWKLLLGELLTPVAILSAVIWLALLGATLAFSSVDPITKSLTPFLQATCGVCIGLVAPPLIALQLLLLNGATLLFPAWVHSTRQQAGGIEVMGQRLIFGLGTLLVIVTALLPAGAAAALLIFILQAIIGAPAAVILATLVVVAVLIGEVWCGLWLLGERFEKFDLSAELRP